MSVGNPLRIENCGCFFSLCCFLQKQQQPIIAPKERAHYEKTREFKLPHFSLPWSGGYKVGGLRLHCYPDLEEGDPSDTQVFRDTHKAKCLGKDAQQDGKLWGQLEWINERERAVGPRKETSIRRGLIRTSECFSEFPQKIPCGRGQWPSTPGGHRVTHYKQRIWSLSCTA